MWRRICGGGNVIGEVPRIAGPDLVFRDASKKGGRGILPTVYFAGRGGCDRGRGMKCRLFLQSLAIAACGAGAWGLTEGPEAARAPETAAAAGTAEESGPGRKMPPGMPGWMEAHAGLFALSDEELAARYLSVIQGAPRPEVAVALLRAVRDESVRRHLMDKTSWGLMAVLEEYHRLLVEAGLRKPQPASTVFGASEAEWAVLRKLAQEDCSAAIAAALSREGLSPGERLGQMNHILRMAREKNTARAAAALSGLPEDIVRVLEPGWQSDPGVVAATREGVEEALAVWASLRPGPVRKALMEQTAGAFLKVDARGAVK